MATSPQAQADAFTVPTVQELGFDPLELRRKYADERERRMRSEGNAQYLEMSGELEHFNDDVFPVWIESNALQSSVGEPANNPFAQSGVHEVARHTRSAGLA